MRYGQIRKYDIANGPGIRTSIFVTGCTHNCKGCFNQQYMDFNYGELWTDKQTNLVAACLAENIIAGLSILGGEPFQNAVALTEILTQLKEKMSKSGMSEKPIWIYSGYTFEEILADEARKKLLTLCNVLVDGRFVEELKNIRLKFRGSENQRIIDIKKSLELGVPVLIPDTEIS